MENFIANLHSKGFLEIKSENGENIFYLSTPCRFRIEANIVSDLKNKYIVDEEIGGVLWAKPIIVNEEKVYRIDKVSYIRNTIEDKPRNDHRKKSNAYRPDLTDLENVLHKNFSQEYLPLRFHTHPVKGLDFIDSLTKTLLQSETSSQDQSSSSIPYDIENIKLLLPRGLIVGNDIFKEDIFIGFYNGFVAPLDFEQSKMKVQEENIKKTTDIISKNNLNDGQKIGLLIGVLLLLFVIVKYRKYNIPVFLSLSATLTLLLTNTQNIENPSYFNKLTFGSVDIYIPKSQITKEYIG